MDWHEDMNATRADMPPNPKMDAHHAAMQKALIEYLTTQAGREERKTIVKEAITEWLDDKYVSLGKWTIGGLMAGTVALLGYAILWANGFHK